ncbi:PREDICTED: cGMP-dependent protein kinase 1-like isoform X1 [Poecilia mexicana]|uniref:cGMP-dependent protein kinase 1-like isoform X1 n=1 Tax=Poecilia mexicana TaxID=48701 RepID=UPI00072E8DE2|nr:PREDICTED: cGMP-dependent protein kinase 1-like isoform X1 [Poecilia mexicana]
MGTLRDLQFALQLKIEELRQRDTLIDELELELDTKDELIRRLQEELDRYRTALSLPAPSAVVAGVQASAAQIEDNRSAKRQTVISEPFSPDPMTIAVVSHRSCDKSQESRRLIQAALLKNDLLKNLDEEEIKAVTACMRRATINQGCFVFQEGTTGDQAFVLEEGRLDVTKDGQKVLTFEPEDMFGEVALLYNSTHTYSVSAQTDSKLWAIDHKSYHSVLTQCGLSRLSHSVELLRSIPFLQSLPDDVISKLFDQVQETNYSDGDYVFRQGAVGDTFYIISKGQVSVTEKKPGRQEQIVLAELSERQWFGEKALCGETIQPVNVMAIGEVTCLVIDRRTFRDVIEGSGSDSPPQLQQSNESKVEPKEDPASLAASTLSDFQIIRTLGLGEFSHVDLVQLKSNTRCVFAMRVLKKKLILNSGQREHILRERSILMEARCPFIVRLYKTFRDADHLYSLTEACLGGNLSRLLKEKGSIDDGSTKFYTACVVEALSFLHCRGVVYRDVKPENVVLDEQGYGKLIGSRCLKRVEVGKKTWTFCGTPGYMAPEIILSKGHSTSADLWSLGVFVFELLSGRLPFDGSDPLKVLTATVNGVDQIEFPKSFRKDACDFIQKLCRGNPSERLSSQRNGAKAIQKHKWFDGFNWDGLCKRKLTPPLIPKVNLPLQSATCALYPAEAVELCTNWEDF